MEYKVTKCICYNKSFAELKEFMRQNDLKNIDELRGKMNVAMNCKLCVPYIEKMILTGQTEFSIIIS